MGFSGGVGADDGHASEMRQTDGRVVESLDGERWGGEVGRRGEVRGDIVNMKTSIDIMKHGEVW